MPDDAALYEVSHRLADMFPESYILETEDYDFDPVAYTADGRCHMHPLDSTHAQMQAVWKRPEKQTLLEPRNAFCEVLWRGKKFHCLSYTYGPSANERHHIVADRAEDAHAFFSAVCTWNSEIHDEILVFRGGLCKKDKALKAQIESSKLDHLILTDNLLDELVADFEGFFASREMYEEIGVAWKRGVLLLGPPGNGKTHFIKAIVNRLGKSTIYVRSLKPCKGTVQQAIEALFLKARSVAPCILILEDLDALVDDANRSYFLNELDGFAENNGILTLATTNHPEKLDPALLERPSRFDRKFTFAIPGEAERRRFLQLDDSRRKPAARLSAEDLEEIVLLTGDFSFAYLKELGLSALMAWARNPIPGDLCRVMKEQVTTLKKQMKAVRRVRKANEEEEEDED